jgi:hypothetical protein
LNTPLVCEGPADEPLGKRLVFQSLGKTIDLQTVIDLTVEETLRMMDEKQALQKTH